MSSGISYRYIFTEKVPVREIEEAVMLAVLATESLYGRARVRTEGSFKLDKIKHECLINAESKVGRSIGYLFSGLFLLL